MERVCSSTIISHCRKDALGQWVIQDNNVHCAGVARLSKFFASKFGMESIGYVAGLLHDLGKERKAFQSYIRIVNEIECADNHISEHNHAYVGMLAANKLYKHIPLVSLALGSIIEAHHRGLYDSKIEELKERLNMLIPQELKLPNPILSEEMTSEMTSFLVDAKQEDRQMLIRMLFSCLVDADYLDTEAFMLNRDVDLHSHQIQILHDILTEHIIKIVNSCIKNEINDIRHFIVSQCRVASKQNRGIFSLTVPTGGGKTIASMVWAISHALEHGMERIIVAIPYTSIIEQTAAIFKGIFGEENVIEHHSLVELDYKEGDDELNKRSVENWDAPIVVTTNVQLFESLFSHKPSKVRKLHNICNSVIILDEAQALPVTLLNPIVDCLEILVRKFGCSLLISTATQPAFGQEHRGINPRTIFRGFSNITEIISEDAKLFEKMKRTEVISDDECKSYDNIVEDLRNYPKVLCIVNSRKDAFELYDRLSKVEENVFHLSKNMYPAHIKDMISKIKELLKDPECTNLKVISTQLIEAGVDIDFPVVFRQEAGLDSIIQAAGRCNREGKLSSGQVVVFRIKDRPPFPGLISRGNDARISMPNHTDIHNPDIISEYYSRLYSRCNSFDEIKVHDVKRSVCELLYNLPHYQTVGENFKLISDNTISIIVACRENSSYLAQLKEGYLNRNLLRKLSAYTVAVRQYTFSYLEKQKMIESYPNDFYVVVNPMLYGETGLKIYDEILEEVFIL